MRRRRVKHHGCCDNPRRPSSPCLADGRCTSHRACKRTPWSGRATALNQRPPDARHYAGGVQRTLRDAVGHRNLFKQPPATACDRCPPKRIRVRGGHCRHAAGSGRAAGYGHCSCLAALHHSRMYPTHALRLCCRRRWGRDLRCSFFPPRLWREGGTCAAPFFPPSPSGRGGHVFALHCIGAGGAPLLPGRGRGRLAATVAATSAHAVEGMGTSGMNIRLMARWRRRWSRRGYLEPVAVSI